MKTSVKKLSVFVMMAAIAVFIATATASAHDPLGIIGEYGCSGGGNLIMTPAANWDSNNPNPFSLLDTTKVSFSSYNAYGVVTFKHNGHGTLDLYSLGTPTAPIWSGASVWNPSYYHITYPLTYTVNYEGEITIEADTNMMKQEVLNPVTGVPVGVVYRDHYWLRGWVSADHKTITVATPGPRIDTVMSPPPGLIPLSKVISHDAQVCIRLND
jgi:hypothetical protein